MARVIGVTDLGTKIFGMPRCLDEQESTIENDGYKADEDELRISKIRPDGCDSVVGENEREDRQGSKHAEINAGAGRLIFLLVMPQSAPNDAQSDQAVAHDHDDGKHGVTGEGRRTARRQ